jgi:hypothetical protein
VPPRGCRSRCSLVQVLREVSARVEGIIACHIYFSVNLFVLSF